MNGPFMLSENLIMFGSWPDYVILKCIENNYRERKSMNHIQESRLLYKKHHMFMNYI